MSAKIAADHLARGAVVYVRQSTTTQVQGNLESQRRQYALADAARAAGFASVTVIDDDLGRSGSGLAARPGFQRLVAELCAGAVGAVFCLEASRLARNGRDWHHLLDLCALTGALVIDPDGVHDPRLMNDRLLLGLKGTMSEYELGLLRQRGLAARDGKAGRGALRFTLPPGLVWGEDGRIERGPDERVQEAVRLVLAKFRELGSARQVFLWLRDAALRLPRVPRHRTPRRIEGRGPPHHTARQVLHHPLSPRPPPVRRPGGRAPPAGWRGGSRPPTAACGCCTPRSTPAPTRWAAAAGGRASSTAAPCGPAGTTSRWPSGTSSSATTTRATSTGRGSRRTSGCCSRTPT